MTSAQIRNSFLEFFREKEHTIVAASSLLPDSPNLLFTNAGMNQFVPIFLGKAQAPHSPPRATDTQKCIRAGGKHNDLEDVGLDTYHHTFFEMLGNWSFGDYFKAEAIAWAWELLVERWKFPASRLYATVYMPGEGDPAEFDQEAYNFWARIFTQHGLDPKEHIVFGNKKDNFWMMGETGPCGPCSELHVDLTPAGNTKGSLVNKGDDRCIEIWNLVFIQYNANADGTFTSLPARHVDTGMGFERVCSVIQCTDGFRSFDPKKISNYNTDVFRPYFSALEQLSGKRYGGSLPAPGTTGATESEKIDVAFRVIADHLRTLTFAIGDGIIPSNEGRGYVLRRILRRAVRYGRLLGFHQPFLHGLVEVVGKTMGDVFTNVEREQASIARIIRAEEESFSKTIDRGLANFEEVVAATVVAGRNLIAGEEVFKLYDTYGFPIDLTQLMARERGLDIDQAGFEQLMEVQRSRSQAAQKKEIISVDTTGIDLPPTVFLGYDTLESISTVLHSDGYNVIVDKTPFYAEMGGQLGDAGELFLGETPIQIQNTTKTASGAYVHKLASPAAIEPGTEVGLRVDVEKRTRTSIHHSATHLLHWALREVLGTGVVQKGSQVGPERLRFDFSYSESLTNEQLAEVQRLMVERVEANDSIVTEERPYEEVKGDAGVMQLFSDKYGDMVRVVDIGGYSRELCGGTHVASTSKIGFVKVIMESGIAAGVRRVEAVAGNALTDHVLHELPKQEERWQQLLAKKPGLAPLRAFSKQADPHDNWRQLLGRQEQLFILEADVRRWEKEETARIAAELRAMAESTANLLIPRAVDRNGIPAIIEDLGEQPPEFLTQLIDVVKGRWFGVMVVASRWQGKASIAANVADGYRQYASAAGIIDEIAPMVGGKGGGKPGFARGAGPTPDKIPAALKRATQML
jgi:alanyl-tRNA synthetase